MGQESIADEVERPCYPELVAVVLAGAFHIITELAASRAAAQAYNGVVVVVFALYLWWRSRRSEGMTRIWGMRTDNFASSFRSQLMFAVPAAVFLCAYGFWTNAFPLPRTFWLVLCLYPLWGIAQQFAVQNLIARNLRGVITHPVLHALVTSILFSVSHYPKLRLMGLVLAAGVGFTLIYRKHPNLWAVGILHGVLGTMACYMVLHMDPVADIAGFFRR